MDVFAKAARMKVRFTSLKGLLSVEDLWDLPLTGSKTNLDEIAVSLNRQLKEGSESFVTKTTSVNEELQVKFDVVKSIIDVKLKEQIDAEAAQLKRKQKQQILELIAHKENEALAGKSLDELKTLLANL